MSTFEKYTMVEMHRGELKKCPYNPRKITAEAKRRLKAGLEKHGLVQPLIFNKRTGYLVGGHQRLSCLDDIHESKDYSLNIAVVDMDEAQEKELVVFLNNTSSMGYWDDDSVLQIVADSSVDAGALGFSGQEMEYFNRLLDEQEKEETASSQYLQDIDETYASLEQGAIENAEEIQQDKLTRKEKWESSVSQFFAPPPPQEGANAKADSELTPEEKLHREKFRATREEWKKKDPDEEVIIRVLFKSEDRCRKWLQHIGVPPETLVIHEKELEF
jgi:hypothetical protein